MTLPTSSAEPEGFEFPQDDNLLTVLIPNQTAAYCYLYEALLWVALHRVPLAMPWDDLLDQRLFTEDLDDARPLVEFEPISDVECEQAGLAPDPSYAEFLNGEVHSLPEQIEDLIKRLPAEHEPRLREELEASKQHYEALAAWKLQFDELLELPKSRLFIALREGRIKAAGRPIAAELRDDFPQSASEEQWAQWIEAPWQEVPSSNWLSSGIDWEECRLSARNEDFALVLLSTRDLIAAFPIPERTEVLQAVSFGNCFVLVDAPEVGRSSNRGRPSYDWESFHVEMASRVKEQELPPKLEALVAEMENWCAKTWKRTVARSTLWPKVKPYHARFARQSKNPA